MTRALLCFAALPMEDKPLDCISARDVGRFVVNVLLRPKAHLCRVLPVTNERLTVQQITDVFNKHFNDRKFICPKVSSFFELMSVHCLILDRHVGLLESGGSWLGPPLFPWVCCCCCCCCYCCCLLLVGWLGFLFLFFCFALFCFVLFVFVFFRVIPMT